MNISSQKSQNLGFSQKQKEELREIFRSFSHEILETSRKERENTISSAFDDFISNVFQPFVLDQAKRWEENDRVHGAILLQFHHMNERYGGLGDAVGQHDDRLVRLEKVVFS